MGAFITDQLAGIGVGLCLGGALYLLILIVNAVVDVVTDWRIATLNKPDAHRSVTPRVQLHDKVPVNDLPVVGGLNGHPMPGKVPGKKIGGGKSGGCLRVAAVPVLFPVAVLAWLL